MQVDAQELLQLSIDTDNRLQELITERDAEYRKLTCTSPHTSTQPVVHSADVHKLDRLAELDAAVMDAYRQMLTAHSDAFDLIYTLDRSVLRRVLIERYLLNLTWKQTAERMNYSTQQVYRLHRKALKQLQDAAIKQ